VLLLFTENGIGPVNRQDPRAVVTDTRTLLTVALSVPVVALLSAMLHRPPSVPGRPSGVTVAPFRHEKVALCTAPTFCVAEYVPARTPKTIVCAQLIVRVPNRVGALSVWLLVVVAVYEPPAVVMAAEALAAIALSATSARTPMKRERNRRDMVSPS
jgi:hypothetical protein